jgi:peptide/nickel transport system substrate-binding protein
MHVRQPDTPRSARHGKSIVPDLAHSWEIAKDGKTYTFHLRQGVQFDDGADFTSADVKATYDRICKPPPGISIPRSALFTAVSEINARDKYTIEFKLAAPRSVNFIMSAFASGWNVIYSKKALEANNYDMRKVLNIPGTGPFKTKRRVENEIWVMERNQNYWNKGLPYLDAFEVYHLLPFSPELGAAILSGRVDYARALDPATVRKAAASPGMSTARFYQSVIHATWINAKRQPFDDPRVRRAMHLLFEKQVLVDVVKDVAPLMMGGFIYPFSEFATPKEQLAKRIGYQDDPDAAIKEAKALLAAAGQGSGTRTLDFMVRDLNHHKLFGAAIQEMLRTVNIQTNIRTVVESVWFGDAAAGNYDLCVGAIVSSLLDPSDYFNAWYRTDGPQNYSFWHNAEFDKLLDEIDSEVDAGKRQALIGRAEDIMEQDPPLVPVAWENILDAWYNYVKGHNPKDYFGIYDVVRFDTFWLDKS